MFKKRKCSCGEKLNKKDNFCPGCGKSLGNYDEEDLGMLGKNDFIQGLDSNPEIKLPFGFNTLFNSLVKKLDKEFKELDKEIGKQKINKPLKNLPRQDFNSGGISISISSFGEKPGKINIRSFGNLPGFEGFKQVKQKTENKIKKPLNKFSEENIKKISTLPKIEPTTNIRRLSNKILYEIYLPEVKSINDVSIIQLENSIEIKAIGKRKAYLKLIPISLPIINYKLSKGKLILEFESV